MRISSMYSLGFIFLSGIFWPAMRLSETRQNRWRCDLENIAVGAPRAAHASM
jgi:hypothetical protein